jgi:threonine dehydrogenase-like Zn-dependent dehydrogenase
MARSRTTPGAVPVDRVEDREGGEADMSSQDTARAFWVRPPGGAEILEESLPVPTTAEVRVRTTFSGISRGTEALVYRDEVPASQREAMRAPFQAGDFPGPVKYGYASVGVVEASPGDASLEGRAVFCLYPHQDRYVVPVDAVTPLPDGLPPARAVLAANMETALNGCWDAGVLPGDRVVVVGAGVVGMLVAWLLDGIPGTDVTVVDPEPTRAGPAADLGLELRSDPPAGADADVVIHTSGTPGGARDALACVGTEGTLVEMSWFGTTRVALPLGESFHSDRLTIRSSQVGRIPPARAPRWTYARRIRKALELLRDPALDVLLTGESDFEDLPDTMARLATDGGATLCHRVRYRP